MSDAARFARAILADGVHEGELPLAIALANALPTIFPRGPALREFIELVYSWERAEHDIGTVPKHSGAWETYVDLSTGAQIGLTQNIVPLLFELHEAATLQRPALDNVLAEWADDELLASCLADSISLDEANVIVAEMRTRGKRTAMMSGHRN